MFYTYIYFDPENHVPVYVGKGKNKRAQSHFKAKTRLGNLLRKREAEGYTVVPHICNFPSENAAYASEIFWVQVFGQENLKTGTLFNLIPAGRIDWVSFGLRNTNKPKQVKRKLTEEHKKKISEGGKGKTRPASVGEAGRKRNTGIPKSKESLIKRNETRRQLGWFKKDREL